MSISNISEGEEDPIYLKKEVVEFTELDKAELIQNWKIMIHAGSNKEKSIIKKWNELSLKLLTLPNSKTIEFITSSLEISSLFDVYKTRCFIFLKQICDDESYEDCRLLQKKLAS